MDANNDLEALLNSAAADFVVQHPKSAPASSTEQHASPAESSGPNGAALTASSETAKDNDRNCATPAPSKPERLSGSQKTDETLGQQPAGVTAATAPGAFDQEQMFKDIFGEELTKEFSEEFAEVLRSLSEQQSATGMPTPLKPEEEQINRTIQETMQKLAENANEAEAPLSDDELVKMLSGMGMGEGMSEEGIMPMMQQMMKQLLSKDILYPSLKDISSKYPDWLSANGGRLTPKELANYRSQHEIMCRICEEYEAEQPNDSQQVQSERFDTILSLMQKMQDYGQPPKEIVSSMAPGMELDENGLPKFPFPAGANPEQCSIM